MNKFTAPFFIFFMLLVSPCFSKPQQDTLKIKLFDRTPIRFLPSDFPDGITARSNLLYLGNGRIALKKISIPSSSMNRKAEIVVRLVSNGDPWDKTGSCFLLPHKSGVNMLDIAANRAVYPPHDTTRYENLSGIVQGENYLPTVELMRFMTPFGVGHFSDNNDSVSAKRRPVYVDGWAPCVVWRQDVTDLLPLLEENPYVGVFVDTWTKEGYVVDVELNIVESTLVCDTKKASHVEPLINTVYYIGQKHPDIFSRKDVVIPFSIPENAKNVRMKYITTGHGGHSGGDEFRPQKNILRVDNDTILELMPWRTDCAAFRRFNPTSGVWLKKRTIAYISDEGKRAEKEIEEPIASSDLSRSNWCPGSDIPPVVVPLPTISAGKYILTISIPDSQPIKENELNHWLVSAYLVWDVD